MAKPEILNVPPREAVDHFRAKGHHVGFDWRDTAAEHHLHSFTVAKAMREDVLQAIRGEVDRSIAEGITFAEFHETLEPKLRSLGWWGRQTLVDPVTGKSRVVQLGSPRRLQIIFDTNLRTAYAKGRWERIERVAKRRPYLRYVATLDGRTRPQHRAWHGTVLPVDHPFWQTHYPPNGWRCRCSVQQLSADDLQEFGLTPSDAPPDGWNDTRPWTNRRTGKVYQVPRGIDPGFGHNVGTAGQAPPPPPADPWAIPELDYAAATHRRLGAAAGSNPGGTFLGSDGAHRYVKFYDDPAQAYGEAVANRAYRELGLDAPVSSLVRRDGKVVGIASELLENKGTLGAARNFGKSRAEKVMQGYSADVWLANWDAVGTGLDNIVLSAKGRYAVARIDQGGALLFRAKAGRKPLSALSQITEWDGFANPSRNPHYARVVEAAGYHSADGLGRKALLQIKNIQKLGDKTDGFAKLVPKVAGISSDDRAAILEALRTRARLLETEIAPRIRAAMRQQAAAGSVPTFESRFVSQLGKYHQTYLRRSKRKAGRSPLHGMTEPELNSVYAYSTSDHPWGYSLLNQALYSADPKRVAKYRDYRDTLNAALAKLPDFTGITKRGTTIPAADLAKHRVGEVVTYRAFTSASLDRPWRGPHQLVIQSRHGKHIEPYSANATEHEVLFAAGTRFKVLSREDLPGGGVKMDLIEVD